MMNCCFLMIRTRYWILSVLKVLGSASRQVWYKTPKRPRRIYLKRSPSPCRSLIHRVVGMFAFSSVSSFRRRWASSSILRALIWSALSSFLFREVFLLPIVFYKRLIQLEKTGPRRVSALFGPIHEQHGYRACQAFRYLLPLSAGQLTYRFNETILASVTPAGNQLLAVVPDYSPAGQGSGVACPKQYPLYCPIIICHYCHTRAVRL